MILSGWLVDVVVPLAADAEAVGNGCHVCGASNLTLRVFWLREVGLRGSRDILQRNGKHKRKASYLAAADATTGFPVTMHDPRSSLAPGLESGSACKASKLVRPR